MTFYSYPINKQKAQLIWQDISTTSTHESQVSINRTGRREPITLGVDEPAFPQAAEGLVANDVGMIVEVG